jgi:signal recognition particle receptor subunit beta
MSILNFATKELTLKIVYYGPGLGGKTTNLQVLHGLLTADTRGKLLSLATEKDRTLFFDLLPVSLGRIKGFTVKIQLYTVPGQVYYNKTRKLVLKGADAVVFVANSQKSMRQENIESLQNMWDNLRENNLEPDEIPTVLQYNKRDLPDIDPVEVINQYLNTKNYTYTEAIAFQGHGVKQTFQLITNLLLQSVNKKYKVGKLSEHEAQPNHAPLPQQAANRPQRPMPAASANNEGVAASFAANNEHAAPLSAVSSASTSPGEGGEEEKKKAGGFFQSIRNFFARLFGKKELIT